MGRWRAAFIVSRIISASKSITSLNINRNPPLRSRNSPFISEPRICFFDFRSFSALPSVSPRDADEFDFNTHDFNQNQVLEEESLENEEAGKIPVKAFFLSTRFIYCFLVCLTTYVHFISVFLTLVMFGWVEFVVKIMLDCWELCLWCLHNWLSIASVFPSC